MYAGPIFLEMIEDGEIKKFQKELKIVTIIIDGESIKIINERSFAWARMFIDSTSPILTETLRFQNTGYSRETSDENFIICN
jgi:hypothetical protein